MTTADQRPGGSYNPRRTVSGGMAGELARLEAQAALSFPAELSVLLALGLATVGPILDLGCGSGAATRWVRAALPALPLIGIDADESVIRHAVAAGVPRAVGDAGAIPVLSGSIGGVLVRYVMQHVPSPEGVLDELRRVLRPGGLLLITEVDGALWGLQDPAFPELGPVYKRVAARSASGWR